MGRKTQTRDSWLRVRFGDVVRQVRDRIDPKNSDLTRYVAGEHMDTDDLRIRRWGDVNDGYLGPAFHMRFKPGNVLYGSRRTYLRKVALADFEGICANTTFVLESADPSMLLPELLPYVMQTESFHDHSTKQSKGSVNPYVNFSDLAWYEFDLPPIEEQHSWAELFTSTRALSEQVKVLARESRRLERSFLASEMNALAINPAVEMVKIGESGETMMGRQRSPDYVTGTHSCRYLRVANVFDDYIDTSDVLEMDFDPADRRRYELQPGDILLNEGQSLELLGRCAMYRGELAGTVCFQNTLIRYRATKTTPQFALAWMRHLFYSGVFSGLGSKTTSIAHLGLKKFAGLPFPLPDRNWEAAFVDRFEAIRESRVSAERRLAAFASTVHRAIHIRITQGNSA